MVITNVTYRRLDLDLKEPYTIAYETIGRAVNFILQIETRENISGYGCAAPDLEVTGESPESVENAINSVIIPYLEGHSTFSYARILHEIKELLPHNPSARAMVDMALYDLAAKKAGVPLYKLLGGYRQSIPTSITIDIRPVAETVEKAVQLHKEGFMILKVKGGLNVDEDIEKMKRIRELFPDMILRFDGNQGYTEEESMYFVKATRSVNIEIFEQPVKIHTEEQLGKISNNTDIPVMADESLKTSKDAFRLAKNNLVNMVNIKLMKVGGILEGIHINAIAKSASLEAMVGCLDECSLGISAGLHFALSRPNIHYADLDGHLDLTNDPYKGLFNLEKGVLTPSENPGLGLLKW